MKRSRMTLLIFSAISAAFFITIVVLVTTAL